MKKIYRREIRHIVANHLMGNKSTAYCMRSKSVSFKVVRKLISNKWLECKSMDGPYMFVRPTIKMIEVFRNI